MAQVLEHVEFGATSRVQGKRFRRSFAKVKKNQSSKSDALSRADIIKVNTRNRALRIRKQILPFYLEGMSNTPSPIVFTLHIRNSIHKFRFRVPFFALSFTCISLDSVFQFLNALDLPNDLAFLEKSDSGASL